MARAADVVAVCDAAPPSSRVSAPNANARPTPTAIRTGTIA